MTDLLRAHVYISGRVQGVFFRATTVEHATSLGLAGWVCNTPDGRVEATFEGSRSAIDEILRWCHEGPPYARVNDVEITWEEPTHESSFQAR
ncbi:MAG: acylphosphatase [Actinomycetota bacterium]